MSLRLLAKGLFCLFSAIFLQAAPLNRVVLVTGGAGYIGSHTCKALQEAGFIPVSYDSLQRGSKELVRWGPLIEADLLDTEALDRAFALYQPCAVFHCAGLRNVGESVQDPAGYYTNNVVGSIHLLNAMRKHQVKYLIFSSSCSVYGSSSQRALSEKDAKAPANPYAKSKLMVESVIQDYASAYPLKFMILRYFNVAGIETEAYLKRCPHSYNFLIPQALCALLGLTPPLQVFGFDYPTPDGTCIRDYIHVKDLACAHVQALQYLLQGKPSDELNLGSGQGYSILEVLHAIEEVTGQKIPYERQTRRAGDVPEAVANVQKAKEVLGFEAHYSDLSAILNSEWISIQEEAK